jgi:hypothetical protein
MQVKKVEKKVKMTVALAFVIVAIGAFLALPPALAEDDVVEQETLNGARFRRRPVKFRLLRYILKNGVPTELEGDIVALEGHVLVVSIDGSLTNVNIPGKWILDRETFTAQDIFDRDPYGQGDSVTIYTLKVEMTTETHTVTLYFAYKIEFDGATASAILPFNIEA